LTTTLQAVYERQQAADNARWDVHETYERVYWELDARARERVNVYEHPDVVAAQRVADKLTAEVAALREEVGGRVFRVVDSKLDELRARIEKLNKKAAKYETEPVTLIVSDEHHQDVIREARHAADAVEASLEAVEGTRHYTERIVDYTFVVVDGPSAVIEGWVFVATLDHDADQGADESVGIRRAPVGTNLANRIGTDAAAAVEAVDLTSYRHASNDCDHCGFKRRRNQTYVLYELATGELRQIGSTCLKDYTGASSAERAASWAEWLQALYSDLGGGGNYEDEGPGGGRIAYRTDDFLANVAAVTRENGWQSRWSKDGYGGFERNHNATADQALANMTARKPDIKVTTEDREEARIALEWVRDDLAERDELDEFQHNLATYCRADYLPAKGDGFVAYAIEARKREIGDRLEYERKQRVAVESEWIGEVKERLKGLTFTVTFTKTIDGNYGAKQLTKGHDENGNLLIWWASGGTWLDQGHTYELTATVKAHDRDSYQNDAKVTEITRVHGPSVTDITVCDDCGERLQPDPEKAGSSKAEICACTIKAREEAAAEEAAAAAAFDAEHAELRAVYDRVRENPESTWRYLPFESFVRTAGNDPELVEALVKSLDEKAAATTEETR
jgi:hypothetical protein